MWYIAYGRVEVRQSAPIDVFAARSAGRLSLITWNSSRKKRRREMGVGLGELKFNTAYSHPLSSFSFTLCSDGNTITHHREDV